MRHIKPSESTVMQEFERIAAEKGWIVQVAAKPGEFFIEQTKSVMPQSNTPPAPEDKLLETWSRLSDKDKNALVIGWDGMLQAQLLDQLKQPGIQRKLLEKASQPAAPASAPATSAAPAAAQSEKPAKRKWTRDDLVKDVQSVLAIHFKDPSKVGKRGPDGFWGPATAKAWNEWIAQTGNDAVAKADPRGMKPPPDKDMYWVAYTYGSTIKPKTKSPAPAGGGLINPFEGDKVTPDLINPWAKESSTMAKNIRTAQDPVPEHVPTGLVKKPHEMPIGAESPTTIQDIDKMLAGTKEPTPNYGEQLVWQIQEAVLSLVPGARSRMVGAKAPGGVDGIWGPKTVGALSEAALVFDLPETTRILNSSRDRRPGTQALQTILSELLQAAEKGQGKEMSTFPASPEHVPAGLVKEPHMTRSWQNHREPEFMRKSSIDTINELVALANDLDEMGEVKVAEAVDEQLHLYKTAFDKLYDITGETGEQLVGQAHPGGGPTMAPAKDEGGKVETVVEEQQKDLKVVKTQPTGKQAAFVARQLVALANRLDAEGKTEAALLVDKTLAELREGSARPFVVNGLRKEALFPVLPALVMGLGIGLTALVQLMSSRQENLDEDLGDYLAVLDKLAQDDAKWQPYASGLRTTLEPYRKMFKQPPPEDAKARQAHKTKLLEFGDTILPQMEQMTNSIPKSWWTVGFGKDFRIRDKLDDVKTSYNEILTILNRADELAASNKIPADKTPSPEAAKEERPYEKQLRKTLRASYTKFKGTVDQLLNGLVKALQDPAKEIEANQMLKGKLNETIDWLKTLRQQKEPTTLTERNTLNNYNNILWNDYLGPLRRNPKLADVFASVKDGHLVREAAPPKPAAPGIPGAPVGPLNQPTAKTGPAKPKPGVRRPAKKPRLELQQLQQLMLTLNLPLGTRKADGVWGPYTAKAWNRLNHMVGGRLGAAPSEKTEGPTAAQIDVATRVANVLTRRQAIVEIAPGISLPTGAFANVQVFMRALATRRAAGIDTSGNLDTAANRKRALELLRGFAGRMEDEDIQLNLAAKLGTQEAQRLPQQINTLLDALGAAETGIPSYRRPEGERRPGYGENQPYGRGEGSASPFGTLEGGRRGRGEGGEMGGYGEGRMSLESRVYNIPDVSGFVNDPMQFAIWAQRYWLSRTREEGEPYAIAYKVVKALRGDIANLQNALMRQPVRNRDELQTTLQQRHEALMDVYTSLPKGR